MNHFKKRYRFAGASKKARAQGSIERQQVVRAGRFATQIETSSRLLRHAVDEADANYRRYRALVENATAADPVRKAAQALAGTLNAMQSTMNAATQALDMAASVRRLMDELNRASNPAERQTPDFARRTMRSYTGLWQQVAEEIRRQSDLARQLSEQQIRASEAALAVRQSEGASQSVEALKRARERLLTPGVTLDIAEDVPRYHADPDVPGRLIRVLRGKRESGYYVDGRFQPVQ